MDVLLSFNGREYRLTITETEQLAEALDARRALDDRTFAALAERLRDAATPPTSAVELQGHEAAAIVLVFADLGSAELARFYRDYAAENLWPHQPLFHVFESAIDSCFALKLGQWFFDEALHPPIGGLDAEIGEDLPPREADFAAHRAANVAFAEAASAWARLRGARFADQRAVAADTLAWLRGERERAIEAAGSATDAIAEAEAGARAWALHEAALWLESCANRSRRPWEAPRHEA